MKKLKFILLLPFLCSAQEKEDNYIIGNNFASEAEYYFHEQQYDSAVYYYEKAREYMSEPHPMQTYNYAKALWKLEEFDRSIEMVLQSRMGKINTLWFSELTDEKVEQINTELNLRNEECRKKNNCSFYNAFIDSVMLIDQHVRQLSFSSDDEKRQAMKAVDSSNAAAVIQFTKKHGFPAGVNTCWDQTVAAFLLHMPAEWFVENYALLYREVVKGNLEPWMLARGLDRSFVVEIGENKISPFDKYFNQSCVQGSIQNYTDPFLIFYNCVSLGVSPYYDMNWQSRPQKSTHFEYYKKNKASYNAAFQYLNME